MSGMETSENLDKLVDAGVVTSKNLPDPYGDVIAGLTDDEVEILISVKERLLSAEHLHQGEPWSPGGADPFFKTFLLF